ncbi:cobalamin B12-binding domain-containing protein [Sphaerospermopsis sp. FACHB-1094]|uniref:cobalamin-dependent protein n=1 Tax=Sphaerospermopsis sp. FACHB-1094 TaxID=2692861 RepID=UPI001681EDC2|nr:cobalamin-dependent protein [Sphaerospermopsis sp. FACHB-1094]MBD2131920.1 cobalamin B12-binding domain-containing protein [Sphaerospermopsis sp. FACHB-1094]
MIIDRVARAVLELNPRIVSCSSTFQQNCASLALLRRIRELNPAIATIMGGANCEGEMGLTLHQAFDWVDFICSGEGDELFSALCQQILTHGRELPIPDSKDYPGGSVNVRSYLQDHRKQSQPQQKVQSSLQIFQVKV